jgi:hypothetical protein
MLFVFLGLGLVLGTSKTRALLQVGDETDGDE